MTVNYSEIERHANNIRKLILDMGKHAGNHAAHMGGALSIADVMSVLYFGVMNTMQLGMDHPERDRCILSKGHASLALYASLMEAGIMPEGKKDTFEDDFSELLGHPVQNRELGIEFTNGSLGMGLSIGIGVALACQKKNLSNRIFVILGDGECNEGSVWEAFMAVGHYQLNNLVAIIDCNNFQLSGSTKDVMNLGQMEKNLQAFGWNTKKVNGHNIPELCNALDISEQNNAPTALILETIKGKGFSFSENDNSWHHAIVTQKIYEQGLKELGYEIVTGDK